MDLGVHGRGQLSAVVALRGRGRRDGVGRILVNMGAEGARPAPSGERPRSRFPPGRLPVSGDLFVGRSSELPVLLRTLTDPACRLLTLTGPPGIGKTRLATAVAGMWAERAGRQVAFVDLASVPGPDRVLPELARSLGVDCADQADVLARVADAVAESPVLVVLDNCEHLLAAAPDLGEALAVCPGLRLLATSRERLRLSAEHEFVVPPLAVPALADVPDIAMLAANPSIALLVERAQRVRLGFTLNEHNASSVALACVRLEGVPLALELAAARLKVLGPDELASRLDARMRLLTSRACDVPLRHRALRTAIGWSHDLLDPRERMLFRRLSVFAAAWTIDDAARVCGLHPDESLVLVESLLDKSLIDRVARDGGDAEFRMLESLREYGAEQLLEHGETDRIRRSHAAHYAGLARRLEAAFGLLAEKASWQGLGRRQANLRAALDHCLGSGDDEWALWLAAALGWYGYMRGDLGDGQAVVDRVLGMTDEAEPTDGPLSSALAAALTIGGILAWSRDELERAESLLTQVLQRRSDAADLRRHTIASAFLGHVARAGDRHAEAARWHQKAELGFRQLNNPQGVAWVRYDLGLLAHDRGDLGLAERWLRESLREFRDRDYPWAIASAAWGLGTVLTAKGETDEAAPLLGEALRLFVDQRAPRGVAQCLESLALVACERAAYATSAQLFGTAAAQRDHLAAPLGEADRTRIVAVEQVLNRSLGPSAAEHARQAGRAMPLDRACDLGQAVASGQVAADVPPERSAVLTRRERQVVALVASGRTNRQIGKVLGVAEKTVEAHLQHAMAKLGARGRAEVAAWAVTHRLHVPGL